MPIEKHHDKNACGKAGLPLSCPQLIADHWPDEDGGCAGAVLSDGVLFAILVYYKMLGQDVGAPD